MSLQYHRGLERKVKSEGNSTTVTNNVQHRSGKWLDYGAPFTQILEIGFPPSLYFFFLR